MGLKHTTQASGTNDGTKQVSVTVWNEVHTVDTSINLPDSAYPNYPTPPASGAELFAQLLQGSWRKIGFIDSDGNSQFFCPHFSNANVYALIANGGTTSTTFANPVGHLITATANAFLAQAPASGSAITLSSRYTCRTSNTSGNSVDIRPTGLFGSRTGGFYFSTTFKARTLTTGNRLFFGLLNVTTALGNINVVTSTAQDKFGVGTNVNTGNFLLIHNTTGTTPTTVDLGTNFPVNTTDFYRFTAFCISSDTSTVYWHVENITTGNSTSGTATTNLPTVGNMLTPHQYMSNNAQSVIVDFDSTGYYMQAFTI